MFHSFLYVYQRVDVMVGDMVPWEQLPLRDLGGSWRWRSDVPTLEPPGKLSKRETSIKNLRVFAIKYDTYIYISYSHPGVEHGHWWQFCLLYLLQDEQICVCIYIHIMDCPFQFWDGSAKNKDSTNKSRWVSSSTIEEWGTPTKVWMFTTKWWLKPSNMILARKWVNGPT